MEKSERLMSNHDVETGKTVIFRLIIIA